MRSAIVVENLRHPGVLKGVAEALGARHVNYGVLQQHYPAVGKALLETLKQYLQENWNPEVKVAWVYAYRGVVKLMLKGANYQSLADIDGERETQEEEEAEIIPPKININSEIGITKSQVDSPIEIIENSFEKIKLYGKEFAASFYENLFITYPEAKPLFANTEMSNQQKKLLNSLVLVVENLRHPEALAEVLRNLGARHINYGTLPQHYPLVGEALLTTLEQYLGDEWNIEVKNAWVFAYEQIVQLMFEGAGYSPTEISTSPQSTSEINLDKTSVSKPSSQLQVEIIENSFEKIKPYGEEFAASFYENLFMADPEAKPLFANTEMSNQQKKLLNFLVLVVESLRHPEALAEVLRNLGARHINYGTLKQHYPLVGKTLLRTLKQYLKDDWTPEVSKAWVYAIGQITRLMFEGAGYINTTKPVRETAPKPKSESPEKSVSDKTTQQKNYTTSKPVKTTIKQARL